MTDAQQKQHRLGLLLAAAAALAWSSAGFWVRLISADLMTMLCIRGVFSGTAVLLIYAVLERGNLVSEVKKIRWPALGALVMSSAGMICGIGSFRFTTVAESMTIYATTPFVTAALAWLFIGERPRPHTLLASAIAFVGVIVMLGDASWDGSLFGKLLAFLMTFTMAGMTIFMRRHPDVPMIPSMAGSAFLTAFICFWFADPLSVTTQDFLYIALFGVVQNASGLVLYAIGSRLIPASEATLLAALEVPFTPLWVWLAFGERPAGAALIGGAIVLAALFGHILSEFRRR